MKKHLVGFVLLVPLLAGLGCDKAKMGVRNLRSGNQSGSTINKLSFPRIISEPQTKIGAGLVYKYQVEFENRPPFPFALLLTSAPEGMTISPAGEVHWATSLAQVGQHRVSLMAVAQDDSQNRVEQSFFLNVTEYCDLETPALGVFLDRNGDGQTEGDKILTIAREFSGPLSAVENYNYDWWAPHIQIGPTGDFFASTVFFYRGPDGLHLFLLLDRIGGGAFLNQVDLDIDVRGNGLNDQVVLADDPERPWRPSPLLREDRQLGHKYIGSFFNWFRADGAVVGPFQLNNQLMIRLGFQTTGQLTQLNFHRNDGSPEGRRYSLGEGPETPWPHLVFRQTTKAPCLD